MNDIQDGLLPYGQQFAHRVIWLSLESAALFALVNQMHVSQSYPLPVMFHPVYRPLQAAIRFLHPPIPHTHQRPLRFACLACVTSKASGRDCHVPRIASIPRLGSVFPPVAVVVPQRILILRRPTTLPFWLGPIIAVGPSVVSRVLSTVHMR